MNKQSAFTGTVSAEAMPDVSFAEMAAMVEEMTKVPFLKELRVDPAAFRFLRDFGQQQWFENQKCLHPVEPPKDAVNVYATGTPIFVDKKLGHGCWKAIDNEGNVMQEGCVFRRTPAYSFQPRFAYEFTKTEEMEKMLQEDCIRRALRDA